MVLVRANVVPPQTDNEDYSPFSAISLPGLWKSVGFLVPKDDGGGPAR